MNNVRHNCTNSKSVRDRSYVFAGLAATIGKTSNILYRGNVFVIYTTTTNNNNIINNNSSKMRLFRNRDHKIKIRSIK